MNQAPNTLNPGETMQQFHERIISQYPEEKIAPAVEFLRKLIPPADAQHIREAIAKSPESWAAPYHMYWGMGVRNELRKNGFPEDYWPIWNLDDIYVPLVERAVRI